jgi:hypothetical protein
VLSEVLATRYTSGTDTLFGASTSCCPGTSSSSRTARDDPAVLGRPAGRSDPEMERMSDRDLVDRFRALLEESIRLR